MQQFMTDPNSPFPDRYSVAREAEVVAELIAAAQAGRDVDESHPLYDRWLEYTDRELKLRTMTFNYNRRMGADILLHDDEATGLRRIGSLVDEEEDVMLIHTKEGYRLFMGRGRDPNGVLPPIVGGKRVASALRALWTLTSFDNPYADWALLRHEEHLREIQVRMEEETTKAMASLDAAKKRGLSYSVLRSAEPKPLKLGFKSPYGYGIAELVVGFDYFVRVVKTLQHKNLRSDDQVRQVIKEVTRFIRARLNETARFERWLLNENLKDLNRRDFTELATEEGQKRREAAVGIFGPVPAEIYTGTLAPRHSRRRVSMTPADRKLLQEAGAELAAAESAEAAEAEAAGGELEESGAKGLL